MSLLLIGIVVFCIAMVLFEVVKLFSGNTVTSEKCSVHTWRWDDNGDLRCLECKVKAEDVLK